MQNAPPRKGGVTWPVTLLVQIQPLQPKWFAGFMVHPCGLSKNHTGRFPPQYAGVVQSAEHGFCTPKVVRAIRTIGSTNRAFCLFSRLAPL